MEEDIKLVELQIDEEQEEFGVFAISLVKHPAFEEDANFVYFGKENSKLTLAKLDEEKRLLVGCALVPEKRIPRYNHETGEEYEVYFKADTIKRASELFLKFNKQNEHTLEHDEQITDLSVVESWIVDDKDNDKSNIYGFSVPVGSWFVSIKVDNDEVWEKIKEKEVKGFSIEGFFVDRIEQMNSVDLSAECIECDELDEITLSKIKTLILENEALPVASFNGEPLFRTKQEAEMFGIIEHSCEGAHRAEVNGEHFFMACKCKDTLYKQKKKGSKKRKKRMYGLEKLLMSINYARNRALAKYPWATCISEQKAKYKSKAIAVKICGMIKSKYGS